MTRVDTSACIDALVLNHNHFHIHGNRTIHVYSYPIYLSFYPMRPSASNNPSRSSHHRMTIDRHCTCSYIIHTQNILTPPTHETQSILSLLLCQCSHTIACYLDTMSLIEKGDGNVTAQTTHDDLPQHDRPKGQTGPYLICIKMLQSKITSSLEGISNSLLFFLSGVLHPSSLYTYGKSTPIHKNISSFYLLIECHMIMPWTMDILMVRDVHMHVLVLPRYHLV